MRLRRGDIDRRRSRGSEFSGLRPCDAVGRATFGVANDKRKVFVAIAGIRQLRLATPGCGSRGDGSFRGYQVARIELEPEKLKFVQGAAKVDAKPSRVRLRHVLTLEALQ